MSITYAEALKILLPEHKKEGKALDFLCSSIFSKETDINIINSLALYFVKDNNLYLFNKAINSNNIDITFNNNILFRTICSLSRIDMYNELSKIPNIDLEACNGKALLVACQKNNIEMVKILIKNKKINLFARKAKAFRDACEKEYTEIMELFLNEERFQKNINEAYFEIAICYLKNINQTGFIEYFKDSNINWKEREIEDIFQLACKYKKIEIIKFLMSLKNLNINSRNGEAFIYACKTTNIELFNLLLNDPRTDLNIRDDKAIRILAETGNYDLFKILLDKGLSTKKHDFKALKISIRNENKKIYNYILIKENAITEISNDWIEKNVSNEVIKREIKIKSKIGQF